MALRTSTTHTPWTHTPCTTALAFLPVVVLAASCARGTTQLEGPAPDAGGVTRGNVNISDTPACNEAAEKRSSVGCEYAAVHMDGGSGARNGCFVVFVANTAAVRTHIDVSFMGTPIDVGAFAKIPSGSGTSLEYQDFDAAAGLEPGKVAILFLAGPPEAGATDAHDGPGFREAVKCPVVPAMSALTQTLGTGIGPSFRVRTDNPVVAYQMLPYGGGYAAVTGATLLIPTSAWGTNYVAMDAYSAGDLSGNTVASLDVVAKEDGTEVTILPKVDILKAPGVDGVKANTQKTYRLDAGQTLQISQPRELTGSPIEANKPIALFAGMPCMNVPSNMPYCDHGEQQIPHIGALGSDYVAVPYRQRTKTPENPPWRIVGVADGTSLSFDPPVGGPSSIGAGEVAEFQTGTPFHVKSQDKDHPFVLVGYMTGAEAVGGGGYGDADFVRTVPAAQYMSRYVFFTDPTYPETNLVVVRRRGGADVTLDCLGTVTGWSPIGLGDYERAYVDLVRHDFAKQGACDNGVHVMESSATFGLTVWGWGTPETRKTTGYVSYGYPAGENLAQLTETRLPPDPR